MPRTATRSRSAASASRSSTRATTGSPPTSCSQTLEMSTLDGVAAGRPVNIERATVGARTPRRPHRAGPHRRHRRAARRAARRAVARAAHLASGRLRPARRRQGLDRRRRRLAHRQRRRATLPRSPQWFEVSLIPETLEATTLGSRVAGDRVNLETDILARHVQRLLAFTPQAATTRRRLAMSLATIPEALDALRAGRPVIVADDENRENEGDVILSAELATPEWIAWTVRWSSGFICAPMPAEWADRLDLPPMVAVNEDARGTAYTVSVDAADRVSTGISATDRAHTLNVLANPASKPTSVTRPGHILPLRAVDGGVRERGGHTEAAVELMRLAGLQPVGAIAEVVAEDGSMMRLPGLIELGERDGVPVITIEQLIAYLEEHEPLETPTHSTSRRHVSLRAEANVPTAHGEFRFLAYKDRVDRHRPPRRRLGRSHRRRTARAGALRVPHRRGVRLAQVRVRPAARGGARRDRAGRRRGHLHARPRGPRHRAHQQAARVQPAGARPRHRRRQPRPGPARRRPRLRGRGRHPRRSRRREGAPADQQLRQGQPAARARPRHRRAGAAARRRRTEQPPVPRHQARPDGPPHRPAGPHRCPRGTAPQRRSRAHERQGSADPRRHRRHGPRGRHRRRACGIRSSPTA